MVLREVHFTASKDITALCTMCWFLPPEYCTLLARVRNGSQFCNDCHTVTVTCRLLKRKEYLRMTELMQTLSQLDLGPCWTTSNFSVKAVGWILIPLQHLKKWSDNQMWIKVSIVFVTGWYSKFIRHDCFFPDAEEMNINGSQASLQKRPPAAGSVVLHDSGSYTFCF